uniref:Uncharacterized protein n=1 Tax=Anguilla anguilla TaxID=7936 RepID=A0A0E9SUW8_ANGAN
MDERTVTSLTSRNMWSYINVTMCSYMECFTCILNTSMNS